MAAKILSQRNNTVKRASWSAWRRLVAPALPLPCENQAAIFRDHLSGAYHGSTQGAHARDGRPVPACRQAAEEGDARSVRGAERLHPAHAGWLLRMWGKMVFERRDGELVRLVVGQRRPRRRSPRLYDQQVVAALTKVWYLFACLCGKRLVAVLRTQVPPLKSLANSPWTPTPARSSPASAPPPATGCGAPRNAPCAYGAAPIPSRPRA